MSRRDTIIIAVLLNAALLVVLFMTAVQTENSAPVVKAPPPKAPPVVEQKIEVNAPRIPQGGDTIDEVLNKYSEVLSQNTQKPKEPEKKAPEVAVKQPLVPKVEKLPHEEAVKTITVVKGDVLEKIARAHGVSVESIMKENNMASTNLRIGQTLRIPRKEVAVISQKVEKKAQGKFYVVKGGDNPWSIAKKNNIQVEELLRLNNMDEAKAKKLRPGDRLRIE